MRAGLPSRIESRRRGIAASALALLMVVALGGCYQNPDPTEYGSAARANFIAGCSTDVTAKNGTTTSILIESKDVCGCIYDAIAPKGKYSLPWEKLKAYEDKQANAKAGEKPPAPPKELTSAITSCAPAGPGL